MVPYCPQLLLLFDCHINIKVPAALGTIKYLSKYIYEGPDRATVEISDGVQDEIKAHLDGQFIDPIEACQKIFEFNIHGESPAIQYLPVHFSNKHYVDFYAHQTVNEVLIRQNVEKTQFTAYFDYNSVHDDSLGLTYWQFPQYYTWNAKAKSWHPRQYAKVIGRMYFVSLSKGEQFFLQLFLIMFKGRKNWEYLRTWNSQVFILFKEACMARGLLEDDHEWRIFLKKAIAIQPGMA